MIEVFKRTKEQKDYDKNVNLISFGYTLVIIGILFGIFGNLFFLILAICIFIVTILYHRWFNKNYELIEVKK